MTADDSIKYRCANSGMTGQVGGFQNPRVCLQAFPSFLPHPLPALLLTPFFARPLTLVPQSLLLNRTETLASRLCEQSFLCQCATPRTSVWEANGAFQKSELVGHTGHFKNEILVFKDCISRFLTCLRSYFYLFTFPFL